VRLRYFFLPRVWFTYHRWNEAILSQASPGRLCSLRSCIGVVTIRYLLLDHKGLVRLQPKLSVVVTPLWVLSLVHIKLVSQHNLLVDEGLSPCRLVARVIQFDFAVLLVLGLLGAHDALRGFGNPENTTK